MNREVQYEVENIKQLIGGKITNTLETPDGESFGFLVQKGKKKFQVWVDCDPEGNGPGHLAIEEAKEQP